jgi:hypothetical protein
VSVQVDTFDTGKLSDNEIAALLKKHFDFRLAAIVREFDLRRLPSRMKGDFFRKPASTATSAERTWTFPGKRLTRRLFLRRGDDSGGDRWKAPGTERKKTEPRGPTRLAQPQRHRFLQTAMTIRATDLV